MEVTLKGIEYAQVAFTLCLIPGTVPITYLLGTNVNARFFKVPAARFSKDPATFRT